MVPDHQVNVKDGEWLAASLCHGQLKTRFIPLARIQELRDLTRYHKILIQERAQQVNRLQKVLEAANIKLSNVASHISSASGRELVVAITQGEDNSQPLAELAYGYDRAKLLELCESLEGRVSAHQRFLISSMLSHMDFLEEAIQNVRMEIIRHISSFEETTNEETTNLLNIISADKRRGGEAIFSDINIDIDRLFYDKHFVPWAGAHLGNRQSSSKRLSGNATRHVIVRELARIIAQDKDMFLSVFYHHQACRLGKKRAIIALAHKWLVISYHVLKEKKPHQELALDHYEQPDATRLQQHHGYRFGQLVINCSISICLMAGLALISHSPFIFPSLGPTVFLFFYKPTDSSSSPRNILMGHAIATIVGYLSLLVTGLATAGPAFAVGVTWPRVIATGLSLGLTVGLMVLFRVPHPPAAATTLIISLGTLTKPWQLLVLMLAVVLLTLQALIVNRLAGIDYPLWRSQPASHQPTDLNQHYQKTVRAIVPTR